jgi:hypothetical protein
VQDSREFFQAEQREVVTWIPNSAGPENMPQHPPIYITDVKNISPLLQLLEQIAKQQYDIKALADNHLNLTEQL